MLCIYTNGMKGVSLYITLPVTLTRLLYILTRYYLNKNCPIIDFYKHYVTIFASTIEQRNWNFSKTRRRHVIT